LADRLLARDVGLAHPVARRLLAHRFEPPEVAAHDLAARARGTIRRAEQFSVVEIRHATLRMRRPASSGVAAATSCRRASIASVTSSRPATSLTTAPASMHAR